MKLGEFTANFTTFDIVPGLHVNIPARLLHGIEAGSEGCEFLWAFPARRWSAPELRRDFGFVFQGFPFKKSMKESLKESLKES